LLHDEIDVNSRDELGNTALIAAAGQGYEELVSLLLSHGADVNAQSKDGTSALMAAAMSGSQSIAEKLLEGGAKINLKRGNGETALFDAVNAGHTTMVGWLLEQGADPNIQNQGTVKKYRGYTPLMYAAQHGISGQDTDWVAMINALLAHNAKPNITNINDDTALTIAERNGYEDIAALLSKHGASNELEYAGLDREEALIEAAKMNDSSKTRELLEGAAKPNYRNNVTGVTSLLAASYYGHAEIVELLVSYGADVNNVPWGLTDQRIAASGISVNERGLLHAAAHGDTALITAIRKGFPEISRFLLDHGADVNVANRNGEIPAFVAADLGRSDIMGQLLANGADPNRSQPLEDTDPLLINISREGSKNPLLIQATINGHDDTVEKLLAAGADVNIRDHEDRTALYWAVSQGFFNIVQALLDKGADPDIKDSVGTTSLMEAAKNGYLNIVSVLLEHGAEINAVEGADLEYGSSPSTAGTTALIYAARGGHTDVVRLLLSRGADSTMTTSNGESALVAAKRNGHKNVVQILTNLTLN
jgi:ankyrin repeat protein